MKSIPFCRIKKKSLTLSYVLCPEDLAETLKEIRYKKLYQCILKEDISLSSFFELKSLFTGKNNSVICLDKLRKNQIISGDNSNLISIWDLQNGICVKTYTNTIGRLTCFSSLSKRLLATGNSFNMIQIWDLESDKVLRNLTGHNYLITCIIRLSNSQIASGSYDFSIKIWDYIETGNCLITINHLLCKIQGLIKVNSTQIVSAGISNIYNNKTIKTIKLWDFVNGDCLKFFKGDNAQVYGITKINKTQFASIGLAKKEILLWEFSEYKRTRTKMLKGHNNYVHSVVKLSKTKIASACSDSIKIWDLRYGNCIKTIGTITIEWNLTKINNFQFATAGGNFKDTINFWDFK